MANITLTIPLPVLGAGEYFKTRYRSLPSGAWSSVVNRTNAAFTLTGLSVGSYQLEVILVKADATQCAPVYQAFDVAADFSCIDFTATLLQSGSVYNLKLNYTLPTGFTNPPCGWDVIITGNTGTKTIPYTTLPPGGSITIAVNNVAMAVRVCANLCGDNFKYCYQGDISPVSPPCTPLTIISPDIVYNGPASVPLPNSHFIRVQIINSAPSTTPCTLYYTETSMPLAGPPDSGSQVLLLYPAPANLMYSIRVYPKAQFPGEAHYQCHIVDACGVSHVFNV